MTCTQFNTHIVANIILHKLSNAHVKAYPQNSLSLTIKSSDMGSYIVVKDTNSLRTIWAIRRIYSTSTIK